MRHKAISAVGGALLSRRAALPRTDRQVDLEAVPALLAAALRLLREDAALHGRRRGFPRDLPDPAVPPADLRLRLGQRLVDHVGNDTLGRGRRRRRRRRGWRRRWGWRRWGWWRRRRWLRREADHVDRNRPVVLRPVTKLAPPVASPALEPAGARARTRMAIAPSEPGHTTSQADDVHRGPAVGRCPVAELAEVVPAPALGTAAAHEGAHVEAARGKPGHAAREAGDVDRGVAIRRRPVSELADLALAPALKAAFGRERTRMGAGSGDSGHAAVEAGHISRRSAPELPAGLVVPELAHRVVPPALGGS